MTQARQQHMQVQQPDCLAASAIQSIFGEAENPQWLLDSHDPIRIGGYLGFILAYVLGLYTILHVAGAYKRFVLKVSAFALIAIHECFSQIFCLCPRA